jgi:hypothetical protein
VFNPTITDVKEDTITPPDVIIGPSDIPGVFK